MRFRLVVDGETREINVERGANGFVVHVDGALYRARSEGVGDKTKIRFGGRTYSVRFHGNEAVLDDGVHAIRIVDVVSEPDSTEEALRAGPRRVMEVRPPMPGRVVRVAVRPGDRVRKGQTIFVLEAMKMQNEIVAPSDGVVLEVGVAEGETLNADRVVASIEIGP